MMSTYELANGDRYEVSGKGSILRVRLLPSADDRPRIDRLMLHMPAGNVVEIEADFRLPEPADSRLPSRLSGRRAVRVATR